MTTQRRYSDDKKFRFHWLDKTKNEGYGRDPADALTRMGYSNGAVRALDWHEELADVG